MSKSITEIITIELSKLLLPLKQLNCPERVKILFGEIGFDISNLDNADPNLQQLINYLSPLVDITIDLAGLISDLIDAETDEDTLEAVLALVEKIPEVVEVIYTAGPNLEDTINEIIPDISPDDAESLALKISRRIFEYLVYLYLQNHCKRIYGVLTVLGILDSHQSPTDTYPVKTVHWSRIPKLFSNPMELANDVYLWNNGPNTFNGDKFLSNIEILLHAFMMHGGIYIQNDDLLAQFGRIDPDDNKEIRIPIFQTGVWPNNHMELDINICPIPPAGEKSAGIAVYPYFSDDIQLEHNISDNWVLSFSGSLDPKEAGLGIKFRAPHDLEIINGIFTDNPSDSSVSQFNARMEVALKRTSPNGSLRYIFGTEEASHLALREAALKFAFALQDGAEEIFTELDIKEFTVAINPGSDADGFLQKILSGINIKLFSDLTFGISNLDGFYFKGSGGLEIAIPIHKELGPISIKTLFVIITIGNKLQITLASSFGLKIGPISGSVEKIGLTIPIEFPEDGNGNLGPVQINSPKFKPPNGVGLSINTDFIVGGGYLDIDNENKRYAGILELKIGEIGLVAIGLIATRMPDGSDGFSLLVSMGVTFSPPIQLSFGFVLGGVGGLIGLKRTMITDVLRDGLKNRSLDSILFPEDPITNASKIISDLRAVFPPEESRFVVGPMVKIAWGSPKIITADIGIFIELPSPVRIVLLGEIELTLPNPDNIIVEMHIDVLGVIDFGKKELAIDASIYDSRIYQLTLSGDAALRWSWGENSYFAVSLGGFHPRFSPPPSIGSLARLSLNISQSSSLQITCWAYNALTSNSLQFGAGVEFYAKAGGASVEGGMSFDALIYFNPFAFSIDMSGHLVARYKGHRLAGVYLLVCLSGPSPWNARGTATFSILLWDISVHFDKTWGKSDNERLPSIDPWLGSVEDEIMGLREVLNLSSSWGSRLPEHAHMFESIKEIEQEETEETNENPKPEKILIHPCGKLELKQSLLPFGINLEKVGNNPVHGHNDFTISMTANNGGDNKDLSYEPLLEDFSRGQYKELNKTERLTLPSFEKMQAGILAGSESVYFAPGKTVHNELLYESIIINPDLTSEKASHQVKARANWRNNKYQIRRNAVNCSGALNIGKDKYSRRGKASKVIVAQEGYLVVSKNDLSPVSFPEDWPMNNGTLTRTKADELMKKYLLEHPEELIQVILTFEYEEVA